MRKVILTGFAALSLSGCHTLGALKDVGDGYAEGDYISSTFMLILTPLMIVPDIFTLGGLLDDQQTAAVWTGAANQYVQYEQQSSTMRQQQLSNETQRASEQHLEKVRQQQLQQQQLDRLQQTLAAQQTYTPAPEPEPSRPTSNSSGSDTSGSTTSASGRKYGRVSNHCLQRIPNSDASLSLRNTCNQTISVGFCFTDVGDTSTATKYLCRPSKDSWSRSGINYITQHPGSVRPGATMNIGRKNTTVVYAGCAQPYLFPVMDTYNSATKTADGYCVAP